MAAFKSVLIAVSFCKGSKKPASWLKPWFLSWDGNRQGSELGCLMYFGLDTVISKVHVPAESLGAVMGWVCKEV